MKKQVVLEAMLFLALLALCVAGRVWSDTPNFTPVAAAALFGGFLFRWRITAVALPLLAMLISDQFEGAYEWRMMCVVYAALVAPVLWWATLRARATPLRVAGASVTCSVLFFVSTNTAVWLFSGAYERTIDGLIQCFALAAPFFRYTLAGDLTWTVVLFGGYAAIRCAARRWTIPDPFRTVPPIEAAND